MKTICVALLLCVVTVAASCADTVTYRHKGGCLELTVTAAILPIHGVYVWSECADTIVSAKTDKNWTVQTGPAGGFIFLAKKPLPVGQTRDGISIKVRGHDQLILGFESLGTQSDVAAYEAYILATFGYDPWLPNMPGINLFRIDIEDLTRWRPECWHHRDYNDDDDDDCR